jgi:thioredoxin 1
MKRDRFISRSFGIALVFVMLTSTLGAMAWAGKSDVMVAGSVDVSAEQTKAMIDSDTNVIALDVSAESEYEAEPIVDAESDGSLSSEIDASLDAGKPVFLFFYADWCHFCQEQMPIIDELELEYTEEIVVIRVNNEESPEAMTEFGVTAFPTMFLISGKSAEGLYRYQEFNGFKSKETLSQSFDWVVAHGNMREGSGVDGGGISQDEPIECEAYWNGQVAVWDGFIVSAPPAVAELPTPEEYCTWCPKPEKEWGKLVGCTCSGNDWWQKYDSASAVELTGCYYERYNLTQQSVKLPYDVKLPAYGLRYEQDYCLDDYNITLHRCVNGVYISVGNYTCPYGCEDDQCICSDTDGGDDPYVSGCVRNGTSVDAGFCDRCEDEWHLIEYYTETDLEDDECRIMQHYYTCPGGCQGGACYASCTDGVKDGDETGIDCGGSCLTACTQDEVNWYAQNYGFKFGNPTGQDLSYGRCWSDKKNCSPGYGHYKDTFGNCEVCICNTLFSCCSGWHVHAGLYYAALWWWAGAYQGQCTGMCLSSLDFYYENVSPQDYDPYADEVLDLEYEGDLKRHIASEQGKILSGEMIDHYLATDSQWWGANDVLSKVEDALNQNPRQYGMIQLFEDDGWGGWQNTVHRMPLAHTLIATNVVYVDSETARIYVYDPNTPVDVSPVSTNPYFDINSSPYIEMDIPSNTYTFYDKPPSPRKDHEGEPWTNSNAVGDDEAFDRIGYIPYGMLHGDVDIPWEWDLLLVTFILPALGSADAQIEDSEGGILGFSEQGPNAPTIENAMILPIFGEPDPNFPTTFAMPMGNYKINVRGFASGNYSTYILGDSPQGFVIGDAEVSAGTRDTISVQYGTQGRAMLSFTTSDAEKHYSCLVASQDQGEEGGTASEALFGVNSVISSGSEALFSVDMYPEEEDGTAHGPALIYSNHGDSEVTYSMQIYTPPVTAEEDWEGLVDIIDNFPATQVHTYIIGPWETHTIYPKDWSNLGDSDIIREVDVCDDGYCDTHENYVICPQDCPSGVEDGYCDGIEDDICDPDCTAETDDPDCAEASDGGDGIPGGCGMPTAADTMPLALVSVTLVGLWARRWRRGD